MIKVFIVEDQALMRDSLEHIIGAQDDMEVAGTTDDASMAPELCRQLKPDLVLMDVVTKNNTNGITFAAQIRKDLPDIKIVVMTAFHDITFIDEARKVGSHSFIDKSIGLDHFLYVIRSTMKGHGIYPGPADASPFAAKFSEKEIALIRLVCQGKTREDMARSLSISESTVGQFITSILDKSGFDSIMRFAVYAVSCGFIVPDLLSAKNGINAK
ncbi:MAG: response regulator transcription factor [Treponema sp.]|jgi:DNA-binding NarL/FixJ family response regulator|nr:response regulator transcription factor [Treponema sp.]